MRNISFYFLATNKCNGILFKIINLIIWQQLDNIYLILNKLTISSVGQKLIYYICKTHVAK